MSYYISRDIGVDLFCETCVLIYAVNFVDRYEHSDNNVGSPSSLEVSHEVLFTLTCLGIHQGTLLCIYPIIIVDKCRRSVTRDIRNPNVLMFEVL